MRTLAILVLALLAAAPAAAQEPINTTCPVLEGEPVEPGLTAEYQGVVIGLCCERCVERFQANPAKYVARMPEWAALAAAPAPEEPGKEEAGLAAFLGPFHTAFVHFPIALLLAAALAELLVLAGVSGLAGAAWYSLWLGALGAVVTAPLGLASEDSGSFAASLESTLEWHEITGLASTGLAVLALALGTWQRRGGPGWTGTGRRTLVLLAAGCVAAAGFLGGEIVHGIGHLPL